MQPRERYTLLGPDGFSDIDLIVLILGTGAGGRSSRSIATALIERFGGLAQLADASVAAVAGVRGVGPARAVRLHAGLSLGRRLQRSTPGSAPIRTAQDAAAWFAPALEGLAHEELHAIYLDRRGRPLCYRRLTTGSDCATIMDSRQILRPAVEVGATSVVLGHNHPSGDPDPSVEDQLSTRRVQASAHILGLKLLDHLIMTPGSWVSMMERGAM
jgi:DNA repair protein RadC